MKKLMLLGGSLFVIACAVTLGLHVNEALGDCPPNIHNIQKSWDFVNCELTVSWDTDISHQHQLRGAGSETATPSTTQPTPETATTTAPPSTSPAIRANDKLAIPITSADPCGSETSSCQPAAISECATQP